MSSQRGNFLPIIILVVLVIVLVVGFYFIHSRSTSNLSESSQTYPVVSASPASSGMSTFTSSTGGYSFQYPVGFKVSENQQATVDGVVSSIPEVVSIISPTDPISKTNMQMSISVIDNQNGLSEEKAANKLGVTTPATLITVDGQNGFLFANTPIGPYGSSFIYVNANNKDYTFTIETPKSYQDIQQYVNQILSTFKFTN